jgi:hypothetical protein
MIEEHIAGDIAQVFPQALLSKSMLAQSKINRLTNKRLVGRGEGMGRGSLKTKGRGEREPSMIGMLVNDSKRVCVFVCNLTLYKFVVVVVCLFVVIILVS